MVEVYDEKKNEKRMRKWWKNETKENRWRENVKCKKKEKNKDNESEEINKERDEDVNKGNEK